jgi:predicted Fe-S protein YdhL (DUF1289 family)
VAAAVSRCAPLPLPVTSPCVGICHLGADGLCEGCLRTGEEIASWLALDDGERRRIMDEVLPARAAVRP